MVALSVDADVLTEWMIRGARARRKPSACRSLSLSCLVADLPVRLYRDMERRRMRPGTRSIQAEGRHDRRSRGGY